jgi:antirestriction protein ArdC
LGFKHVKRHVQKPNWIPVFNAEQIDGLPAHFYATVFELRTDYRPQAARTAAGRYREPILLDCKR